MTRLNWLTLTAASVVAVALVVALPGVAASTAGSAPAINPDDDFAPMFERLKTLVGTWDEQEYGRVVEYHLTGEGSALIEEFVGDPPMSSVYHMDGGDLRLTHYCNAGNQPRMRAASYDPESAMLRFEFVDVTNLTTPNAYHTRELAVAFIDEDHVVLSFVGLRDGEELATKHSLTRRSEPHQTKEPSTSHAAELDPEVIVAARRVSPSL